VRGKIRTVKYPKGTNNSTFAVVSNSASCVKMKSEKGTHSTRLQWGCPSNFANRKVVASKTITNHKAQRIRQTAEIKGSDEALVIDEFHLQSWEKPKDLGKENADSVPVHVLDEMIEDHFTDCSLIRPACT